jgi:hypothetical protein
MTRTTEADTDATKFLSLAAEKSQRLTIYAEYL